MSQPTKWTVAGHPLLVGAIFGCFTLACHANGVAYPMHSGIPVGNGASPGIHAMTQDGQGNILGSIIQYQAGTAKEGLFSLSSGNVLSSLFQFDPLVTGTGSRNGTNTDGAGINGVVLAADGALYGSAQSGGASGYGTLFKLAPDGQFTVLHTFTKAADGASPTCLIAGNDGNFYGTTTGGGAGASGTVFQLSPAGTLTTLYSFPKGSNNSPDPTVLPSCPTLGSDGNLYGVKYRPGHITRIPDTEAYPNIVYRVTPAGKYSLIATFTLKITFGHGVAESGEQPGNRLTLGSDGNLYGVMMIDGGGGQGNPGHDELFRINLDGSVTRHLATLPPAIGAPLPLPLLSGPGGLFYGVVLYTNGTTSGTVFDASASGTSNPNLYVFGDSSWQGVSPDSQHFDGYLPTAWMTDSSGRLIVASLGFNHTASIFRIEPDGGMNVSLSDGGPIVVRFGDNLNLDWSATGASQCAFVGDLPDPSLAGSQPFSGQTTVPLTYGGGIGMTLPLDFAFQCSNENGGITRSMLFLEEEP